MQSMELSEALKEIFVSEFALFTNSVGLFCDLLFINPSLQCIR